VIHVINSVLEPGLSGSDRQFLPVLCMLKNLVFDLEFDDPKEFYGRLTRSPDVINWNLLAKALEAESARLHRVPEKFAEAIAALYRQIHYLKGISSVQLILGHHVLRVTSQNFPLFSILPKTITLNEQQDSPTSGGTFTPGTFTPGSNEDIKLVVLGSTGVGKSTIVIQFVQNVFIETCDPTIEDSYRKQITLDGQQHLLDILDTVPRNEERALLDGAIIGASGILLVYDITSRTSFDAISGYQDQVKRLKQTDRVPMILVGNKSDLEYERVILTHEGQRLADSCGCSFIEMSAKGRSNIIEAFNDVVRQVLRFSNLRDF